MFIQSISFVCLHNVCTVNPLAPVAYVFSIWIGIIRQFYIVRQQRSILLTTEKKKHKHIHTTVVLLDMGLIV